MLLFIFEFLGTAEVILIGIVALIFLGPRKLPEIAKKMGKIMADFRNTTSEFKETWEREVNFEEEAKALRNLDDDPVPRITPSTSGPEIEGISAPEVKQIDAAAFNDASSKPENGAKQTELDTDNDQTIEKKVETSLSDKKNWL